MLRSATLWCTAVGSACAIAAFALRGYRDGGEVHTWPRHELKELQPESGHAFTAKLPAGAPSFDRGPLPAVLFEDGKVVGAAADHESIRKQGGSRYSFWHGMLYLSSSDGSDPRRNGRQYAVAWPSQVTCVECVARTSAWAALALGGVGWLLVGLRRRPRVAARILLVPASLFVTLGVIEGVMRWRYPFADSTWPGRFDASFGFAFQPGATVRQTNLFDFCVEEKANSLGFLDREPVRDLPAGTRRIVVLGDSFVQAAEVPIAAKFHVLLEGLLGARQVPVAISAFGMSGCGTSNELAFHEQFGRALRPDLVVLLFVKNDFANTSPLLEAVRNGWHPDHLPRLFFREDGVGVTRLPIDAGWQDHLIPTWPAPPAEPSWWSWSRLYRWTKTSTDWIGGTGVQNTFGTYSERLAWLRRDPAWREAFAGWRWPDDDDLETMTIVVDGPPVFGAAVRLTEGALAALRDRVVADGSRLLVVGCHNLGPAESSHGRSVLPRGWLDLIRPMCDRLGLPLLDLHADFTTRGMLDKVTFVRDLHWNTLGHASAAAAIDGYLRAHPELLAGR